MNYKRNYSEYRNTTDRRVYNICHFADQGHCCLSCRNRERRDSYHLAGNYYEMPKHPSWKLVSKNPKQWMNKPTYLKTYPNGYVEIKW